MIIENLRYLLYHFSPFDPLYFGHKFQPNVHQGYMGGGAGYVISKEALKRFALEALNDYNLCSNLAYAEDVEMGQCLENVGVIAGDSRDFLERGRFFSFDPQNHFFPHPENAAYWYWKHLFYKTDEGLDCCSDTTISFHYIEPVMMYLMDYLIYRIQPYGIKNEYCVHKLPKRMDLDTVKSFNRHEFAKRDKEIYNEYKENKKRIEIIKNRKLERINMKNSE